MRRGRLLALSAGALLVGVVVVRLMWPTPEETASRERRAAPVSLAPGLGAPSIAPDAGAVLDHAEFVRGTSLAGTEPDGALVVDANGAFVPTRDAIDFFDYFLSAIGEVPDEAIVATIEHQIRARIDPPDAALALLGQYLAYRDEVRALVEAEGLGAFPLDRRVQWLRELRRDAFGEDLAARLFDEEEMRTREALARRDVALDPTLDPDERADRLAALDLEVPEAELARRERVTLARRVLDHEAELRAEGAGQSEIQAWREQELGEPAAARLAALDLERAEWDARVAHYRGERALLEASVADEHEAAIEIDALRESLFNGAELLRIAALDEAAARGRANER